MTVTADSWLGELQDNGYRLTAARRAIVDTVANSQRAITPLEVYDAARRHYRELGLVSVYRTLEKLEQLGLVQRVHQHEGCQAFIAATEKHQHLLLCRQCGRTTVFEGDHLGALMRSISRKTGYLISEHWLQLFGLCEDCQSAK
jgi:Fur family ferric uptake transcriptional regulator